MAITLLFLPFKNVIRNLFSFLFHKITVTSKEISQENEKLKKDNILLKIKVKESKHLRKENLSLKEALNFKADNEFNLVGVGVLSFSPSSWRRYLIINGGEDIGLEKGLLALDKNGKLIGKITEVKKTFSHLLLITDPNFDLSVFVGELGSGLLKGHLTGAKILYIEEDEAIKKGDRVWVRSGSSISAIEVGKVKNIKKGSNQLFCDITVELASEDAFFDKVFIIK